MNGILFKAGADTRVLGKAGVRILARLDELARRYSRDLTITCANDGHASPDPHVSGEAFDVRTHGLQADQRSAFLADLVLGLSDDPVTDRPAPVAAVTLENLATRHFFAQIENPGLENEHLHVQRRNGSSY